jgi:hypothetical protein
LLTHDDIQILAPRILEVVILDKKRIIVGGGDNLLSKFIADILIRTGA